MNPISNKFGQSPFFFGADMESISGSSLELDTFNELPKIVDKFKESIGAIQKVIKILSFGIDYKKYVKFAIFMPILIPIMGREEPIVQFPPNQTIEISDKEFEFAYNFIIESALKLQEFDFEIKELEKENKINPYVFV